MVRYSTERPPQSQSQSQTQMGGSKGHSKGGTKGASGGVTGGTQTHRLGRVEYFLKDLNRNVTARLTEIACERKETSASSTTTNTTISSYSSNISSSGCSSSDGGRRVEISGKATVVGANQLLKKVLVRRSALGQGLGRVDI